MNKVVDSSNIFKRTSSRAVLSFGSLKVIAALLDAWALLASSVSAFFIYNYYLSKDSQFPTDSLGVGTIVGVLFILIGYSRRFYQINAMINPAMYMKRIWTTIGISILLLVSFMFILKVGGAYSRGSIVVFSILAPAFVAFERLMLARISTIGVEHGVIAGRRGVIVGAASELEKILRDDLRLLEIEDVARVGVVQSGEGAGLGEKGRAQIGDAINLARALRVTEFVLIIPWTQELLLAEVSDLLSASPLSIKLLPDSTTRKILGRQGNRNLDPPLVVEIKREPLDSWERFLKRSFDLILAVTAAVLLTPVFFMTAVAIKIDSNGPVLFRQRRVGFDNREFVIYKFRTMTVMDDGAAVAQACRADPRVTRVGRLLRRSSIDELPQIFNIVRGDMSIVGPRPHAVAHHDQYSTLIASYAVRHHMKPGLTGMAQIRGLRGETRRLALMERRVEQDLWYINHWSLALDLMIIVQTCFALLRDEVY